MSNREVIYKKDFKEVMILLAKKFFKEENVGELMLENINKDVDLIYKDRNYLCYLNSTKKELYAAYWLLRGICEKDKIATIVNRSMKIEVFFAVYFFVSKFKFINEHNEYKVIPYELIDEVLLR